MIERKRPVGHSILLRSVARATHRLASGEVMTGAEREAFALSTKTMTTAVEKAAA
jgi:hypothetical protein